MCGIYWCPKGSKVGTGWGGSDIKRYYEECINGDEPVLYLDVSRNFKNMLMGKIATVINIHIQTHEHMQVYTNK